ncbi:ABC transporter substrate-binding protein [Streptomyces stramineus]
MSALVAGCALLGGTLAGCGSGGGSSASGSGDTLSVGLIAEPYLDFTTTDGAAIPQAMLGSVYEGLVRLDQQGKIRPHLAERYDRSDDGRTYTFHLRKGVKFTSGAEFTADDAVFSVNRVKSDWKLKIKKQMDVVEKAEKVDDRTVKVTLSRPSNGWLFSMTTRVGAMFSRTGVKDLANHPVGTGPFALESRRRGDRIVLKSNADYWGTKPELRRVTLKYFKDAGAMNNALLTKGIDVLGTVQAPESLSRFADKNRFRTIEGTSTGEVVLSMNNTRDPFKDKRVRQAVRHAIDHKALVDTARSGHGKLIGTMATPTDPWYEDLTGRYPHDPAKARQLLKDAGAEEDAAAARAQHALRRLRRPGGEVPARPGRPEGGDRDPGVPRALAVGGLHQGRLRHVDHRPQRAARPVDLRRQQLLLPLRQPRLRQAPPGSRRGQARGRGRPLPRGDPAALRRRRRRLALPDAQPHGRRQERHRPARQPGRRGPGARERPLGREVTLLLRKLAALLISAVVASFVVFAFLNVLPGDPAEVALGTNATPDAVAALRHEFGTDRTLAAQYADWAQGLLHGDFGTSYVTHDLIGPRIADRLGVTCWLAAGGMLVALLFALPAGVLAAAWHRSPAGAFLSGLSQAGIAIPAFLAGILLVYVFAVRAGALPAAATPRSPRIPASGPGSWSCPACPSAWSRAPSSPATCAPPS